MKLYRNLVVDNMLADKSMTDFFKIPGNKGGCDNFTLCFYPAFKFILGESSEFFSFELRLS